MYSRSNAPRFSTKRLFDFRLFLFFYPYIKPSEFCRFDQYWLFYITSEEDTVGFFFFNYPFSQLDTLKKKSTALFFELFDGNPAFIFKELTVSIFKHENAYTKLKYSRVPQFDASATTAASFLSALIGYLICEKTGFELLDSGDLVFTCLYTSFYVFLGSMWCFVVTARFRLFNCIENFFASFVSFRN